MRRASRTGVRLRAPGAGKPDSAGAAREREIALSAASPWRYPRNRAGRGYLVEDPFRELRAARAAESGRPARPARTGAPRRRRSGALAAAAAARFFSLARARRVSAARLVRGDAHVGRRRARSARVDLSGGAFRLRHPRALSTGRKHRGAVRPPGAERRLPRPPPFQAPSNERFILIHLHPRRAAWSFQLSGERPRLFVNDRAGGLTGLPARLGTVPIEPDLDRVSLVWSGVTRARRPYLEPELARMPFQVRW